MGESEYICGNKTLGNLTKNKWRLRPPVSVMKKLHLLLLALLLSSPLTAVGASTALFNSLYSTGVPEDTGTADKTTATAKDRTDSEYGVGRQGAVWLDTDGNPINAHGAGMLYHNGKYYLYGEYKKGQTTLPSWAKWECYRTDVAGVSCYSSPDLRNWKFEGIVLQPETGKTDDLHKSKVLERPKVIYNEKTGKFVMWAHVDSEDYAKAAAGVAVSDSPTGPFTYLGSFRPNNTMSRDQTVFVDDDGRAYQFSSSENNKTMHVNELTDDYLRPTGRSKRIFIKESREAPAVFKRDGKYYILTSGCTGWDPNRAEIAVADSIMGEWTVLGDPCTGPDADKTFFAQSTYVQPVHGRKDCYLAMFDRWNKKDLEDSRYVWLPVVWEGDRPTIPWRETVNFDGFDTKGTFVAGDGTFLLDGKPFVIKAAELHYPRIPREYWDHRIKMVKALGMNTICLYAFWNAHEPYPDRFDFSGQLDLREFIKLCGANDMKVILRPGPYVCAEWDMGGMPWWLLRKKNINLRHQDPYFMERAEKFIKAVSEQTRDLTVADGGPVIMMQVENEYGCYSTDKPYVSAIRDILRRHFGRDIALFQCDWSSNFLNNGLPGLTWTINFGTGANIDSQFAPVRAARPDMPLMCSEYWSGWYDHWGDNHETRSADKMVAGIDRMLSQGISFSLYMTHGGTTFGHWGGANTPGYMPDVTSYDYDAPIDEQGAATPKYHTLRKMLARYTPEGQSSIPKAIPVGKIAQFRFTEVAPLFDNLPEGVKDNELRTMENYNQGFGSILYRTILPAVSAGTVLTVSDPHDYARVFVDGRFIGKLDRRLGEKEIELPAVSKGARLDILVDATGRVNYGPSIKDMKGITGRVTISEDRDGASFVHEPNSWEVFCLPDSLGFYNSGKFLPVASVGKDSTGRYPAGVYRGTFTVKRPADTFLSLETFGKGNVYVNGHAIGRFWEIGPQQALYIPGVWLRKGENEITVYDVIGPREPLAEGLDHPVLNHLNVPAVKASGKAPRLTGLKPVMTGRFEAGNGWKTVRPDVPVMGRYLIIEALDAADGGDNAAIAELYVLDTKGRRISREEWVSDYTSSADTKDVNCGGDKVFDQQESTYWSTPAGTPYPHTIVIDMGRASDVGGIQYLPRTDDGAPGLIGNYRIYVK